MKKNILSFLAFLMLSSYAAASVTCSTGSTCPSGQHCHQSDCCTKKNGGGTCNPQTTS